MYYCVSLYTAFLSLLLGGHRTDKPQADLAHLWATSPPWRSPAFRHQEITQPEMLPRPRNSILGGGMQMEGHLTVYNSKLPRTLPLSPPGPATPRGPSLSPSLTPHGSPGMSFARSLCDVGTCGNLPWTPGGLLLISICHHTFPCKLAFVCGPPFPRQESTILFWP